jgi:L-lactate dehydrogenase complex protein LldG
VSTPVSSRSLILDRVRAAIGRPADQPQASPEPARAYIRQGQLDSDARIALMVERLREYDADVVECASNDLVACINDRLTASGKQLFAAPPGIPSDWTSLKFPWKLDRNLSYGEIEQCEGVLTAAFAGIADSGTIVLHHSPSEGRRVITLLPDWHLCVLRASQIVETLPEYFDRCATPPALATYISGPSATADIEMTRVKGVHGPRFLNVILVHDENKGQQEPQVKPPQTKPEMERQPEVFPRRPHRAI